MILNIFLCAILKLANIAFYETIYGILIERERIDLGIKITKKIRIKFGL